MGGSVGRACPLATRIRLCMPCMHAGQMPGMQAFAHGLRACAHQPDAIERHCRVELQQQALPVRRRGRVHEVRPVGRARPHLQQHSEHYPYPTTQPRCRPHGTTHGAATWHHAWCCLLKGQQQLRLQLITSIAATAVHIVARWSWRADHAYLQLWLNRVRRGLARPPRPAAAGRRSR